MQGTKVGPKERKQIHFKEKYNEAEEVEEPLLFIKLHYIVHDFTNFTIKSTE